MAQAQRDSNQITTLIGVSNADDTTAVNVRVDPTTRRLLVDSTGSGGTSMTDDAAFTPGTTSVVPIAGTLDDTSPDSIDEGDAGAVRMSANRNLYVRIRDNAGNERGLNVDENGAIAVTGGGGGTQFAEDAAHVSADVGTMALAVRTDTPANRSGTDGDYEPLQLSGGRLWASTLVTGAALTSLELIDDTVFTDDAAFTPATSKVIASGFEFDDTLPDSVDEGDIGAARMSSNRNQYVQIRDNAGNERGLNIDASGNIILGTGTNTIGALTANQSVNVAQINGVTPLMGNGVTGTGSQRVTIASDNTAFSVNIGTFPDNEPFNVAQMNGVAVTMGNGVDGTGVQRITLASDSTGNIATIGTSVTPGTAATNLGKAEDAAHASGDVGVMALAVSNEANTARAADGDYIPIATDTEGNVRTVGNRDHDAVDAGELVGIGLRAIAHSTNPTAVAAADRTVWFANRAGVPFVIGGHPNIVTLEAAYTAAQTDAAIVTVASGLKIVVTEIEALCDNANTVDVGVRVGFGATTTPTTTGVVLTHPGIAAGSGVARGNGSGILGVGADGEDLRITSEVPTTGSLRILVSYYTIES